MSITSCLHSLRDLEPRPDHFPLWSSFTAGATESGTTSSKQNIAAWEHHSEPDWPASVLSACCWGWKVCTESRIVAVESCTVLEIVFVDGRVAQGSGMGAGDEGSADEEVRGLRLLLLLLLLALWLV